MAGYVSAEVARDARELAKASDVSRRWPPNQQKPEMKVFGQVKILMYIGKGWQCSVSL